MSTLKIIDIDQLPQDKRKYHVRKGDVAYFPYLLNDTFFSLFRYQIYNLREEATADTCFIHALKMSGMVDDAILSNIIYDIGDIPYMSLNGIQYVAQNYGLKIFVDQNVGANASQAGTNNIKHKYHCFGFKKGTYPQNVIKLAMTGNHIFLSETIPFNINYLIHKNDPQLKTLTQQQKLLFKEYDDDGAPVFYEDMPVWNTLPLIEMLLQNKDTCLVEITAENLPKLMAVEANDIFTILSCNYRSQRVFTLGESIPEIAGRTGEDPVAITKLS